MSCNLSVSPPLSLSLCAEVVAEAEAQSPSRVLSPSSPERLAATPLSVSGGPPVPRPVKSLGTLRDRVAALLLAEEFEPVVFLLLATHSRLRLYPADVAHLVRLLPARCLPLNEAYILILFTGRPCLRPVLRS